MIFFSFTTQVCNLFKAIRVSGMFFLPMKRISTWTLATCHTYSGWGSTLTAPVHREKSMIREGLLRCHWNSVQLDDITARLWAKMKTVSSIDHPSAETGTRAVEQRKQHSHYTLDTEVSPTTITSHDGRKEVERWKRVRKSLENVSSAGVAGAAVDASLGLGDSRRHAIDWSIFGDARDRCWLR